MNGLVEIQDIFCPLTGRDVWALWLKRLSLADWFFVSKPDTIISKPDTIISKPDTIISGFETTKASLLLRFIFRLE